VQVLLRLGEDADGGLGLAQVVVDADQRLHCRAGRLVVLQLLVVQRLGERVALLRQRAQRSARTFPPKKVNPLTCAPVPCRSSAWVTGVVRERVTGMARDT